MSVAETQKLSEVLYAIYDLTGARMTVRDSSGRFVAACPENGTQAMPEQLRIPIVRGDTEVGCILIETAAQTGAAEEKKRLESAAKLVDAVIASMELPGLTGPKRKTFRQMILDHIHNDLSADLSVQTLCRRFAVSKTELYRLLREDAPGGVAAYVREKRLQKACALLRDTDIPVWEIAEAVGYNDHDYFLRVFKRKVGISAAKYRKEENPII